MHEKPIFPSENQIYLSSTSARHYSSSSSSQTKILRSSDAQERKRRRSEDAKFFDSLKDVEVSVIDDSILKITLDRPHRMNALSEKMGESIISLSNFLGRESSDDVLSSQPKDGTSNIKITNLLPINLLAK